MAGPPEKRPTVVRDALHTAALALLLVPATVQAADSEAGDKIDLTWLQYGEQSRTRIAEPVVRFTHLMPDGQSFSAQLGIDIITGASPTGALPSGQVQTHTTPSGRVVTSPPGQIPTAPFQDHRLSLDADWKRPLGRLVITTLGGHVSREKDYQSLGANGEVSVDVWHRMMTLTAGGSINHDSVFPVGGTPAGLSDGTILHSSANAKRVGNIFFGASRILSRKWMAGVTGSRTFESGYLTEPYKLVSVMNDNGQPVSELTDKRPSIRNRTSLLFSSVYHLTDDVLYNSYRYYTDSWKVRSHTLEIRYRHQLDTDTYIEPLLRFYTQSAASFYTVGLHDGAPLPDFASSDYRLGRLQTITLGATYGFAFDDNPGNWVVRAEYIRQAGDSSPPGAVGIQRGFDLAPPVNIYAIVVGYTFKY